ncbi:MULTISPECIES: right-handed parallel beta-helix repeat-containing protein [Dethiosulfovibrio]|uniref:Right-handed parallel beta-helix repeat-containing protein n=2 Tax=Dethiosulfovibrio TaxID=47054 RepID=A0ABS9ERK0_9BACT|nr:MULTISPECIES: right-handed parallel beta-helix repeat-containing protein [Dethiosulfovibrio]MCF4142443.1 right-handed parallel beta-helix repeat-containing protein [Dethiosulfovibrio marinus]
MFLLGLVCFGDVAGAASLIVTSGADDGSPGTLRYAVEKASSGQTISIEVDTVTLTTSLSISKSLTLQGNPTTIYQAGTQKGIILSCKNSIWKFYDLVITTDGSSSDNPGLSNRGHLYLNDCTVTNCIGSGGIHNMRKLTMRNCTVSGNTLSPLYRGDAAGIDNEYPGILTMHDCLVENNINSKSTSSSGGGIANDYILFMYGCTLRNNSSTYGGGMRLSSSSQTVIAQECVLQDNTPDQISGSDGYTLVDDGTCTIGTSPGRSSVALAGMASNSSPEPRSTAGEADVIVVEKDLGNSDSTLYGEVREALSGDISGISGDLAVSLEGMNASLYNAFAYENVPLEDVLGNGELEIEFTASWPRYVRYYAAFALAKEDGTGTEDVKNLTPEGYVLPERGIQFEIRPGQTLPEGVNPPDFYETGEGLRTWRNTVEDNGSFDLNPDNGVVTFRVCSIRAEAETPTPKGGGTGGCDVGTGTVSGFSMLLFLGLPLIMKLRKNRWF